MMTGSGKAFSLVGQLLQQHCQNQNITRIHTSKKHF